MQLAKKRAPVVAPPDRSKSDVLDDGQTRYRGWIVPPRDEVETDEQFLARLNAELIVLGLPRFYGTSAGDDSCKIIGMKGIRREGACAADLCLVIRTPTGTTEEVLLEAHEGGYKERAPLVVPFVRTERGIYVLVVRESRCALYLDEREMRLERRMSDGSVKKPRKGWINGFLRAFALRAGMPAMGEQVFRDTPVHAPFDRTKLARAAKRVVTRKAGTLFARPGVRPIRFTFLDRLPENSGRSAVWINILALEIAIDDPDQLQRLVYGDSEKGIRPERFGPAHMKGKFIPWSELLNKRGREGHDVIDALSVAAVNVFREALEDGRLKARAVKPKRKE